MQWSQLRKRLKERLADSIKSRIDVHQTRYRHAHDQEGEIWLSVDGNSVFNAGSSAYLSKLGTLVSENIKQCDNWSEAYDRAWPIMNASGLFLLEDINRDLFDSLNQTVEQMLNHKNPLIRALALADYRYGKRRLLSFQVADEHPLVQIVFYLRCDIEGIKYQSPTCI